MAGRRIFRKFLAATVLVALLGGSGVVLWTRENLKAPAGRGEARYIRFDRSTPLEQVLSRLEREGVIRSATATRLFATYQRDTRNIPAGTYQIRPAMSGEEALRLLRRPVRQMVRLPETNWAARTGRLLEKYNVTTADEYMALVRKPKAFEGMVDFPLPKDSLEGYLYPDTYDLPPMLGARGVIERQLKAFERKVWEALERPKNLHRTIIVASLVELETKFDNERPIVAGVVENRLRMNMPLQIDATVLYAQGVWKEPTFRDLRETDSPYNTYKNRGLPPGPICSPNIKSIRAALNPAEHRYVYYVALPNGTSLFSATYDEHRANIRKRKAALAELRRESANQ